MASGLLGFGAGAVGGATVSLFLDKTQFEAGLAEAEAQTKTGTASMGASTSKFSTLAKAGFAAAATSVVAFGVSSVKAFEESQKVTDELANTLRNMPKLAGATTDEFQKQATALQNLTGYQDEEILSADNVLARFRLTSDQIKQAIPIVLDYARATGMDAASAASNIGKALLGNSRALKTVGIDYHATGNAAADFNTILGALNSRIGGTAQTFGTTFAGKVDIAKAKLDDFKELVGGFLASGLLALTGDLDGAAQMWVKLGDSTEGASKAFGDVLQAGIEANKTFSEMVTSPAAAAMDTVAAAAGKLADQEAKATEQAKNLYAAELSLAGGFLGVEGAVLQTKSAQDKLAQSRADLNKLTDQGKQGTDAYRQALEAHNNAVNDAAQAQLGLVQQVQSYIQENGQSRASTAEAIAMVRQYGRDAGLTGGEIHTLVGQVLEAVGAYGKIPKSVHTDVTNNLGSGSSEMAALESYWLKLQSIPTHKDVFIVTHYSTIGAPGSAGGPQ